MGTRQRLKTRGYAGVVGLAAVILLALAGCAGNASTEPSTPAPTAAMDMPGEVDDHETFAFGEPADSAAADRTIAVEATTPFVFEPAEVTVEAGEIVTFEVTNTDAIAHDFLIGDQAAQNEHEEEMRAMEGASEMDEMDHTEPNAIEVPAGETVSITWKFADAGTVQYGCHEPGHYAAGMHGDIVIDG